MKSYLDNFDSIFGKKRRRIKQVIVTKTRTQRKVKRDICPHCATKNLIRKNNWSTQCRKCGYEGT
jgi:hypothetical protein